MWIHSTLLTLTSNGCNKHRPWGRFYVSISNTCQSHQKVVGEASLLTELILLMLEKSAPLCHGVKRAATKLHGCKITESGRCLRRRLHLNIRVLSCVTPPSTPDIKPSSFYLPHTSKYCTGFKVICMEIHPNVFKLHLVNMEK